MKVTAKNSNKVPASDYVAVFGLMVTRGPVEVEGRIDVAQKDKHTVAMPIIYSSSWLGGLRDDMHRQVDDILNAMERIS